MRLRLEKGAELSWCLSRAGFEDAAQMALIGEAGVAGDDGEVGPFARQHAANELHAQPIHEFRHGATVVSAKNAREVDWMHSDLGCDFFQRK